MEEVSIQSIVLLPILLAMQSIGFYDCDTEIHVGDDHQTVTLERVFYKSTKDQGRNIRTRTVMVVQLCGDMAVMEVDLLHDFANDYNTITFPYNDPSFPQNIITAIEAAATQWPD